MAGLEGLLAGRVLGGRYLIEEVIGRGGMGAVYRALDERLGRRVAVKVITLMGHDADAVERLRARFHREARAAAALPHHPNVVPVYDYGTDEALGLDYIVMELLRGEDLASRLARSGPPPLSTALRILLQAARGLGVGHRAGLIHRDVKPGNIFLAEEEQREVQVRVVDFGIAKLADEEDTANQLTQDGRVPHSPAFASPEQLRGLSKLTPASDVFSLGAVGYLLLTGERPFTDADRNRMSLGMPVPPPVLRSSHPAIPAGVEVVVQKALAFDAADRYADAGAMLDALDEAIRSIAGTPLEPYAGVHFDRPTARPRRPEASQPAASGDMGDDTDDRTHLAPGGGAVVGAAAEGPAAPEDERTQILGAEEEDRTLIAPPPAPPPGAAGSGAESRAFPPRQPQQRRKSRLGLVVWTLVLLGLGAVAFWAWMETNRGEGVSAIPPAPDTFPDITTPIDVAPPPQPDAFDALDLALSGQRQFAAEHFDSALANFRMAVELEPDNGYYRRNLGLTLRKVGEDEAAVEHFQRAVELDPTLTIARYDLAGALLAVGDTTAAREQFASFADQSAADPDLVTMRRLAIQAINRIRRAQMEAARDSAPPPLPVPDSIVPVVPAGGDR